MINQTFVALGNNRPQIIVQLEDSVLQAIMAISEGKSRENSMDLLYKQLSSLEKDLANDQEALSWFDITKIPFTVPSTPPLSEFPKARAACKSTL